MGVIISVRSITFEPCWIHVLSYAVLWRIPPRRYDRGLYIISNARTLDPILSLRLLICTRQEVLKHVLRLTAPSCLHLWFNLPAELFRGRHLRFPISAHQRPAATSVCACVINYSRDAYVHTAGTGRGSTGKLTFWLVLAVAVCAMKTLLFVCVFVAALTGVVYAQSKSTLRKIVIWEIFRAPCVLAKG